jgi:hypothetical protein
MHIRRSQWPSSLRHRFAAALRILLWEWMCATSWPLVHKSPTNAVRCCVWSRDLRMRKQGPQLAEGPQGKQIMLINAHIHIYIEYGGIYSASRCWNSVGTLPRVIMVTDSNTKWLLIPKTVSCWEEVDLLVNTASQCCGWLTPPTARSNRFQLYHDSGR